MPDVDFLFILPPFSTEDMSLVLFLESWEIWQPENGVYFLSLFFKVDSLIFFFFRISIL